MTFSSKFQWQNSRIYLFCDIFNNSRTSQIVLDPDSRTRRPFAKQPKYNSSCSKMFAFQPNVNSTPVLYMLIKV